MSMRALFVKGAVPVGYMDNGSRSDDHLFQPSYVPRFTTVEKYIEDRSKILQDDFGIRLTDWDVIRLRKCKTENQVNNTIHTIINEHWR